PPRPPCSPHFPYTTLFRSRVAVAAIDRVEEVEMNGFTADCCQSLEILCPSDGGSVVPEGAVGVKCRCDRREWRERLACEYRAHQDRKSTRLNSSHVKSSYA